MRSADRVPLVGQNDYTFPLQRGAGVGAPASKAPSNWFINLFCGVVVTLFGIIILSSLLWAALQGTPSAPPPPSAPPLPALPPSPPLLPAPPSVPPSPPASPVVSLEQLSAKWCAAAGEVAEGGTEPSGDDSCVWAVDFDFDYSWGYDVEQWAQRDYDPDPVSLAGNGVCDEMDHADTGPQWRLYGYEIADDGVGDAFVCGSMTDVTDCCAFGSIKTSQRRLRDRRGLHSHVSQDDITLPLNGNKILHILADEDVTWATLPRSVGALAAHWLVESGLPCEYAQRTGTEKCALLGAANCELYAINVIADYASVHCEMRDGVCARAAEPTPVCAHADQASGELGDSGSGAAAAPLK